MLPALQNTRERQTGGFLTGARNFANRALGCPTEAKLFPGEKHAQLGRCSASTGTRFLTRVERGDVGHGPIDSLCSYEHDRAYSKAGVGMQRGDLSGIYRETIRGCKFDLNGVKPSSFQP